MLNKKISVIIVNYKSKNFLKKCIHSICDKFQKNVSFEIVIVNNDSELLESEIINNPIVRIINNGRNIGFGAGNNIGVKNSQGDILFFLNPDTEIISIDIEEILLLFNNEKLGVIGCQLRSVENKTERWSAGSALTLFNLIRNNLGLESSRKFIFKEHSIRVDWVSAAAIFIKKNVFKEIGGFDENFFMYFEDMDICRRVAEKGREVLYFPKAIIKHYGGESYQNKKIQKRDYYLSQKYYFKKHRNIFEWLIIKMISKLFYNV